ncbi:MAG: ribonuclease P protein subunit [Nitrososphaerales archaeon]
MYSGMLIGKKVQVAMSPNKSLIGFLGVIADETENLVILQTSIGKLVKIPKSVITLDVIAFADDKIRVTIQGSNLIGTPAERIKG